MQLITLTTDWGTKDFFAGMVKGKLYSDIPQCQVVDISHGIAPQNKIETIVVVKNACPRFPEGTIHIIDVNSFESDKFSHIVIKNKGHYYICTDNGIPYGLFENDFEEAYRITVFQDSNFYTFAALDLYVKVAEMIAKGIPLDEIGEPVQELFCAILARATVTADRLEASVTYIDNYGNVYLNVSYDEFIKIQNGRQFKVLVKAVSKINGLNSISQSYADVKDGECILTVSATGFMQIALNQASAAKLFWLKMCDKVVIEFKD